MKKNDILRIYSLEKLIHQEITRLNHLNLSRKTFAEDITTKVYDILGTSAKHE